MQIDTTTYRKDIHRKPGDGYGWWDGRAWRAGRPTSPASIVIHTTNGKAGSAFAGEAAYLRDSAQVSAHYLVGKDGQIAQILAEMETAWHAGDCLSAYTNTRSIGIECHLTTGEAWSDSQRGALYGLVRAVMGRWGITTALIDTHRAVALPRGRKSDPCGWDDAAFYAWRATLTTPSGPHQVIGVVPSISRARFQALLAARKAPFDPAFFAVIGERIYALASWLDIDPAFWLALWSYEQGVPLGGSTIGQATHNPLNIKAYGRWPKAALKGAEWNVYESWQLGALHSLMHLKQIYGAAGLIHAETIIPVWAPAVDNNNPDGYLAAVLRDMAAMQE